MALQMPLENLREQLLAAPHDCLTMARDNRIEVPSGDALHTLIETGAVEKHIMDRLMKAAESSANKTILTTLKTALNAAGGLSDAS